jgi:hypothetical protein
MEPLLLFFKKEPLAVSFKSTGKPAKFKKLFDSLYQTLQNEKITGYDRDAFVRAYLSRPRIITQGVRVLDVRNDSTEFSNLLLAWVNSYGECGFELLPTGDDASLLPSPSPDAALLKQMNAAGVTSKNVKKLANNMRRLPPEQQAQLKKLAGEIPADTSVKVLRELRERLLDP